MSNVFKKVNFTQQELPLDSNKQKSRRDRKKKPITVSPSSQQNSNYENILDEITKDKLTTFEIQNIVEGRTGKVITVNRIGRIAKENDIKSEKINGLKFYPKTILPIIFTHLEYLKDIHIMYKRKRRRKESESKKLRRSLLYITDNYMDAIKFLSEKSLKKFQVKENFIEEKHIPCLLNLFEDITTDKIICYYVGNHAVAQKEVDKKECENLRKELKRNKVGKYVRMILVENNNSYISIFF